MKDFEDFKKYLDKKEVTVDNGVLTALELYHDWLQNEALKIDGKEVCRTMREELRRRGESLFT